MTPDDQRRFTVCRHDIGEHGFACCGCSRAFKIGETAIEVPTGPENVFLIACEKCAADPFNTLGG